MGRPKKQKPLSAEIIETRCIRLMDESGVARVVLMVDTLDKGPGEEVIVRLCDTKGLPRLSIELDGKGNPSIRLYNSDHSTGVSIVINEEAGNWIGLTEARGMSISLGVTNPDTKGPPSPDAVIILRGLNGDYYLSPNGPFQRKSSDMPGS